MSFHHTSNLKYYRFELLEVPGLVHGIYTRQGGVSPSPWDSLNLGGTVGDVRDNVIENRRRIFETAGRPVESIFDAWQVHGVEVICSVAPRPLDSTHIKADIILTDRPEITLFMRFADCVPVFLYDPARKVVGIVHAGWQGTVKKACEVAVQAMKARYGSNPADVLAGIGPSVGSHHYPVGAEVIQKVQQAFGGDASGLLRSENGAVHFDLWEANRLALEQSGVKNIQISNICTVCNLDDWYSHRGEHGKTGRFGALLAMTN